MDLRVRRLGFEALRLRNSGSRPERPFGAAAPVTWGGSSTQLEAAFLDGLAEVLATVHVGVADALLHRLDGCPSTRPGCRLRLGLLSTSSRFERIYHQTPPGQTRPVDPMEYETIHPRRLSATREN